MICHDRRCVFVHVPKTAGVSMYQAFDTPRDQQHHHRLSEHQGWSDSYFKFAFVRNPWDRFLSSYSYFCSGGRGGPGDVVNACIVREFTDFTAFVRGFHGIRDRFCDRHFYPQVFWMDERLDFVGRYENLDSDFRIVCDKIGLAAKGLQWFNPSAHDYYLHAYTPETVEIVADLYREDIEYFGYRFSGESSSGCTSA